ncbi:MAG: prepilin peptidase [Actinomycetota bacterium]|nr:prepilin peptidase [Actinomycetota bacterium]
MHTILIVACGLFGLAIGSFVNVVIYRVPLDKSVVRPRSSCPSCSTEIRARDNIPVLSWMMLKGRCRSCGASISKRYPTVELSCAALFAATGARIGLEWDLPALLVLLATLLALALIDLEHYLVPKRIVYWSLAMVYGLLVVASAATGEWHRLLVASLCAIAWFGVFFVINASSPRALGYGDVRLALLLGVGLGWLGIGYVVVGFFAANLIGATVGVALIVTKKMERRQRIPYAVFLAIGAAVAIFTGSLLLPPLQPYL